MIKVSYKLELRHLFAYQYEAKKRTLELSSKKRPGVDFNAVLITAFLGVVLVLYSYWLAPVVMNRGAALFDMGLGFVLGVVVAIAGLWLHYFRERGEVVRPDGPTCAPHELELSGEGICVIGDGFETRYAWRIFDAVTEHKEILILWIEPSSGLIVPRSAFEDQTAAEAFLGEVRTRMAEAKGKRSDPLSQD